MNRKPKGFEGRLQHAIELLKKAEKIALRYSTEGFYLAFSGGKDSQCIYELAKKAEVRFHAYHNLTTIDPPELVKFIRSQYSDVSIIRPPITFANLCIKKKILPTREKRFCCDVLKHRKGAGRVVLTGVRAKESRKRSHRKEFEIQSRNEKRQYIGEYQEYIEENEMKEVSVISCVKGKDRIVINPIIDWSEEDVWYFLNEVVSVKHCELYDQGWRRIGCLFCPLAKAKEIKRMYDRYPKYYALMIRTITKMRNNGLLSRYPKLTAEDVFKWWVSKTSFDKWYAENKLQGSLFENTND